MKNLYLFAIILPLLFSCSKKKGCNYNQAVNYDKMVVVDDGSCTFTSLSFYADNDTINGKHVDFIEITVENNVIGSFSGKQSESGACNGSNTVSYAKGTDGTINWVSTIHLEGDTINPSGYLIYKSGAATTSPSLPCIAINALY